MRTTILTTALVAMLAACGEQTTAEEALAAVDTGTTWLDDPAPPPPLPGNNQLWETCGDPVCGGWRDKNLRPCPSWAYDGRSCPVRADGLQCDLMNGCNTTLLCSDTDPTLGGCPISVRSAKTNIDYVDPSDAQALHDALMGFDLATYTYRTDGEGGPTHLGFIIDDIGKSPAIAASGTRVDLYGYTSMAVAALQVQQKQLEAMQARIDELEAKLAQ